MKHHLGHLKNLKAYEVQKLERGEWLGTYPIGYAYEFSKRTKFSKPANVYIDPKESLIVQDIFFTYAQGKHGLLALAEYISAKYEPFKIGRGRVHQVLKNKFYIGIMTWKGHEYTHIYPKFIEKELYERCQEVMRFNSRYILYGEKFEVYPVTPPKVDNSRTKKQLSTIDLILERCKNPCTIEQLCSAFKISIQELRIILLDLELDGRIRDNGSGFWFAP